MLLLQPGCGWGGELYFYLVPCSERVLSSTTYHEEGISDPQTPPSNWAVGNRDVLTVDRYGHSRGLAHRAAADVGLDFVLCHRHHGQRGSGGQPVGLVIPAGVVTDVTRVAVQEGHGAEPSQAGACQPCGRRAQLSGAGKMLPGLARLGRPHVRDLPQCAGGPSQFPFLRGNRLHWHFSPALRELLTHTYGLGGSAGSGVYGIAPCMKLMLGVLEQ